MAVVLIEAYVPIFLFLLLYLLSVY